VHVINNNVKNIYKCCCWLSSIANCERIFVSHLALSLAGFIMK